MNFTDIKPDEFSTWLAPSEALALAKAALGNEGTAATTIGKRLRDDLLLSGVEDIVIVDDDKKSVGKNKTIPAAFWNHVPGGFFGNDFWKSRSLEIWIERGTVRVSMHGLRFRRSDVEAWLKDFGLQSQSSEIAVPSPKHAGGAPRKNFWDDLWAAIGAQLYNGDLKPTKQADIEQAMLSWAVDNKEDLSEATARRRASKIWALIKGS